MPRFRFKIVKTFHDSLSRQVAESVRIDLRNHVLNSKSVYSRNRLPRLEVEKQEWEREEDMRKAKLEEWKKKVEWDDLEKGRKADLCDIEREENENLIAGSLRMGCYLRGDREDDVEVGSKAKKRRRGMGGDRDTK